MEISHALKPYTPLETVFLIYNLTEFFFLYTITSVTIVPNGIRTKRL